MIDEEKLIEAIIEAYPEECINKDYYNLICDIMDVINEQPKVNDWIPVEERLPDKKGLYLVSYHPCHWDNVWDEIRVGIDTFMGKTSWAKRKYQRVIAWTPLPKPYEGVIK